MQYVRLLSGNRDPYTVEQDFTPLARHILHAPSSETMHGPTGVRGVQAVPNSLHWSG